MRGNRKLLVTLSTVLGAFLLALLGKLSPEFTNLAMAAVTSYNVANAWKGRPPNGS
jgi:hypothetical protein